MKSAKKRKKNIKENNFLIFVRLMKDLKENQIQIKLLKNLYNFKLFNFYIDELQ